MRNIRTLRGRITANSVKQLIQADGMLNHGYRVLSFYAWPSNVANFADWWVSLGLDADMDQNMNAEDNRQIGWTWAGNFSPTNAVNNAPAILDPDHIVIEDLWMRSTNSGAEPVGLNYLVVVERVSLTDDETVMQLIKQRSQDDEMA